jgi:hypothetical protein
VTPVAGVASPERLPADRGCFAGLLVIPAVWQAATAMMARFLRLHAVRIDSFCRDQ